MSILLFCFILMFISSTITDFSCRNGLSKEEYRKQKEKEYKEFWEEIGRKEEERLAEIARQNREWQEYLKQQELNNI